MNGREKAFFAFFAVSLMLCAPLAYSMADEEKESDGELIIGASILILGIVVGVLAQRTYDRLTESTITGNDDIARASEADALITGIAMATNQIDQAYSNYPQMWELTQDHWTRQAELAAAAEWKTDASYDPNTILTSSGEYLNAAAMLANAASHTVELFKDVDTRTSKWQGKEFYEDGKLMLTVSSGGKTVSCSGAETLHAVMGAVARNVQDGKQAVYYGGGSIYSSGNTTITSLNGHTLELKEGWNQLTEAKSFADADIYYLTPGMTFCGPFMKAIDVKAVDLDTGIAFVKDSECLLVSYNGSTLSTDGNDSIDVENGIMIRVVPDGKESYGCDYSHVLVQYHDLFRSIEKVQTKANQASRVVWNVYTDMGAKCASLTTLSIQNTYSDVEWTDGQMQMVLNLVMRELSGYWSSEEDNLNGKAFDMTPDSASLFCRGSVKLYSSQDSDDVSDVVFTPFFYKDTTLKLGSNSATEYCYIIVWGKGVALKDFSSTTMDDAFIMYAPKGAVLNISEMTLGGENRSEVFLDCKEIDWVDPYKVPVPDPVPYQETDELAKMIQLILIILGGALIVFGFGRGSYIMGIAGVAIVVIGLMFAEDISGWIEKYLAWGKLWPF